MCLAEGNAVVGVKQTKGHAGCEGDARNRPGTCGLR